MAGRPGRLHAEGGKKDIGQFGRIEQHEGVKGEVTIVMDSSLEQTNP
jgi:hypothetical protein